MTTLTILSAGAAQAVMRGLGEKFTREHGAAIEAAYGAVGAIKARVLAGEPVDAIILTAELIDELIAAGVVVPGSRVDLGEVGTALAVRAGGAAPDVRSAQTLAANLLAASRIICPDPAVATAGKVFLQALAELGILERVRARLEYSVSGAAAMASLMAGSAPLELAVVQATEAIACAGAVQAGPLPPGLQRMVTYSIGLAAGAENGRGALDFSASLQHADARAMLETAGFAMR